MNKQVKFIDLGVMDYKDAWATLFENEPKVKTTDIMFMMETKCATKNETLH